MARSQANLQFGVFAGLRGLTAEAKLLYFAVLVEPTVNQAGAGALRLSRWTKELELSHAETEKALHELDEKRFVLVDEDTEEILVRTLIRNDGVQDQPNVLWAAVRAAVMVQSPRLRKVLADELRKLPPQRPDKITKTGRTFVHADPHAVADRLDPPPPERPTGAVDNSTSEPIENPSGTLPEPSETEPFSNPSRRPGGGGGGGGGGKETSVGGPVGGSRAHTREAAPPTPHTPRCEMPCHVCRDARLAEEHAAAEHERAAAEVLAADRVLARRCRWCNTDGWRIDPDNPHRGPLTPGIRCDHRPVRLVDTGATA
jgi:hypothetical protein